MSIIAPDVSAVLPCYNERDHIELEIKRIRAALEDAGLTFELICVDDGSTDGTGRSWRRPRVSGPSCCPGTRGRARPGGSAPSRPPAGWWSGPTPT